MKRDRVISFVDGLNLYHAISRLKTPHFQWLNLIRLSQFFIKSRDEELTQTFYFSTLATHTSESAQKNQTAYITALKIIGVKPILGQFKEKNRFCSNCSSYSKVHEEKETDVSIALTLLDFAYQDYYDRALLISNDSDLTPAIRKVHDRFPAKKIILVTPPRSRQCNELIQAAANKYKITDHHLQRSLLPEIVLDSKTLAFMHRPKEYDPLLAMNAVV
jgi:uncharacterized LabA/DUF88 family protein